MCIAFTTITTIDMIFVVSFSVLIENNTDFMLESRYLDF